MIRETLLHSLHIQFLATMFLLFNITVGKAQCLSGDCNEGQGVLKFKSGTTYIGEFSGGKFEGTGIMVSANGDRFIGKWKSDVRTGYGKLMIANGNQRFEGEFKNNMRDGFGIQYKL